MSENVPPKRHWLVIALCLLILFLLVAVPSFFILFRYIDRSTPDKTLDAFCSAVLQGNYQSAYDQFSGKLQQAISEETFAGPLAQDKVTACTHGTTGDSGNQVINELKLVHASRGKNDDMVTLVKDRMNNWKIDDIARR